MNVLQRDFRVEAKLILPIRDNNRGTEDQRPKKLFLKVAAVPPDVDRR